MLRFFDPFFDFAFVGGSHSSSVAVASFRSIALNFIVADAEGNIGWRVSGAVPIRSSGGRAPVVVEGQSRAVAVAPSNNAEAF